jgi:ABC-type iron transport system FetAB ATPase subunit
MTLRLRGLTARGLAPLDFELAAGECVAVMGPSGSGKSLLLRAIADLDPNEGAAMLDGEDRAAMTGPDWRRRIGYLAAVPGWWADRVGAHFTDRGAALPLIETLGFEAATFDWPVARLSTGEGQRLALVRLLVGAPKVLLLDEPTAAVDETSRDAVEGLLKQRMAAGVPILIVTHDSDQARRLAKRTLKIDDGAAREGTP